MASTAPDKAKRPAGDRWVEEMKVTFDSEELASFFDGFEPLELSDDGFPCDPPNSEP